MTSGEHRDLGEAVLTHEEGFLTTLLVLRGIQERDDGKTARARGQLQMPSFGQDIATPD